MTGPKVYVIAGSDAARERAIVLRILETLQLVYDFAIYRWEDAVPGFGDTAHALIAGQIPIRECDVVVAILWRSPGEPMVVDQPQGRSQSYSTLQAILDAIAAYEQNGNGLPRIMMYRKLDDPLADGRRDAGAVVPLAKLLEFLEQFEAGGKYPAWIYPFYGEQFEGIFKQHIGAVLRSLLAGATAPGGATVNPPSASVRNNGGKPRPTGQSSALAAPWLAQAQQALLAAFDRDGLEQVVYFAVGLRYQDIVASGSLEAEVFHLLTWAQRQDKLADLIATAHNLCPGNAALTAVAKSLDLG